MNTRNSVKIAAISVACLLSQTSVALDLSVPRSISAQSSTSDDAFLHPRPENTPKYETRKTSPFYMESSDLESKNLVMGFSYGKKDKPLFQIKYRENPYASMKRFSELEFGTKGAWNLRMNYPVWGKKLKMFGEMDLGAFDPDTGDKFADSRNHMYRLGFKGKSGGFSYGGNFRSAGEDYKRLGKSKKNKSKIKAGKGKSKIWGGWQQGRFGFKSSVSREWNNVHGDPDKARVAETLAGVTLDFTLANSPYVGTSVSYFQGTRASEDEPNSYQTFEDPIEKIEASLYASGKRWNTSFSSSYLRTLEDPKGFDYPSETISHNLSASYYPISALSLTLELGRYDESYVQYENAETVTHEASLSFDYTPAGRNFEFSAYSGFDMIENQDWYQDTQNMYFGGSFTWWPDGARRKNRELSLHIDYNNYEDMIYSDVSNSDAAVWLIFRQGSDSAFRFSKGRDLFRDR